MVFGKWMLVAGMALPVVACGGGGSSGGLDTGLPGDQTISSITPADAVKACKATESWAESAFSAEKQKRWGCNFLGVFAAATAPAAQQKMTCEAAVSECLKQPDEPADPDETGSDCADAKTPSTTCKATVAEYEACINDSMKALAAFADSVSCSNIGSTTTAPPSSDPASCKTLKEKCPELADEIPSIGNIEDL